MNLISNLKRWITKSDLALSIFIFTLSRAVLGVLLKLNVPEIFKDSGLGFVKIEFNGRLGSWDGDIYRKIAEGGYRAWEDIALYSFLPGWPFILRTIQSAFSFFTVVEWGIILNQLLTFSLIYLLIKTLQQLNFQRLQIAEVILLVLFYPSSVFFNFNYNEVLFLNGILLIILAWLTKKYSLAALITLPFVLIRFNIVVVLYGLVIYSVSSYVYKAIKQYRSKNPEVSYSEALRSLIKPLPQILKRRLLFLFLLILAPLPLFAWFELMKIRFGGNLYLLSQKVYFNREVNYTTGIFYAFYDAFRFLKDSFPTDQIGLALTANFPIAGLILSGFYGIHAWFNQVGKLSRIASLCFILIWLFLGYQYGYYNWNNQLSTYFYINILPFFLMCAGLVGMWKNKGLRVLSLASVLSMYLPLSTATFTSFNRYLIQAVPIIFGYYSLFLTKNKYLYYAILAIFIAGYALLLFRFTHFQWAG